MGIAVPGAVLLVFLVVTGCGPSSRPNDAVTEFVIVGELLSIKSPFPCGYFLGSGVAGYRVHQVVAGTITEEEIAVAVPCPEISRPRYSDDAGTLQSFELGAYHLIELAQYDRSLPAPVMDPEFSGYYLVRADPYERSSRLP